MHQSFENPNFPPRGIQGAFTLYMCVEFKIFPLDKLFHAKNFLFCIPLT